MTVFVPIIEDFFNLRQSVFALIPFIYYNNFIKLERQILFMKKTISIILVLAMLLCFAGCSNKKTYYTDKEHFEISYYPNSADGSVFANGINGIQIVMNTPNVESGQGEIALFESENDREIFRYDMRMDTNHIFFNTSKSPAYAQTIILLPEGETFESGKSYYVTMDEKCFYIDDIKGFSPEIKKGDWEFTIAEYGIDGNINDIPIIYLVGSKIEVPVKLGDGAASAILSFDNVSVLSAEIRELRTSGVFELDTLSEGTSAINIMFLDEDGKYLETLGFNVTVK